MSPEIHVLLATLNQLSHDQQQQLLGYAKALQTEQTPVLPPVTAQAIGHC